MPSVYLTRQQSREVDRRAIEDYGMTGLVLMENAGRGVVDTLEELGIAGPVVILCGKGNNGGDGFVIARHLEIRGYECRVILLYPSDELTGDALTNFNILRHSDVPIVDWQSLDRNNLNADWLLDAMLGTGASGEPRSPVKEAIEWMNDQSAKKLAVDVPSGLDCDTGKAASVAVRADHTCTFVASKQGFAENSSQEFLSTVHVCDIGTPPKLLKKIVGR